MPDVLPVSLFRLPSLVDGLRACMGGTDVLLTIPECCRGLFRFRNSDGGGPRKSAPDEVILRCPELTGDLFVVGESVCAREARGDCFSPTPTGGWVCTEIFGKGTVTVRLGRSGRVMTFLCNGKCCGAPEGDMVFELMRAPSFFDLSSACTSIPTHGQSELNIPKQAIHLSRAICAPGVNSCSGASDIRLPLNDGFVGDFGAYLRDA